MKITQVEISIFTIRHKGKLKNQKEWDIKKSSGTQDVQIFSFNIVEPNILHLEHTEGTKLNLMPVANLT